MTKISEAIKYYESIKPKTEFDSYFGDPYTSAKIQTLTLIQDAIGDVDLSEEYLKAYIYGLKSFPYKTPYERMIQKVRIIYDLSKDTQITTEDLLTLIGYYHSGAYSLMSSEIKKLISTCKDLKSGLRLIVSESIKYGISEAEKLDYLKEEYSKSFVERIQEIVKEECLSSDKVLQILPSKSFIDASEIKIPKLGYTTKSGEDIVTKRLSFIDIEESYQKTLPDEQIKLGYSSYGEKIYTSFTKTEYEEDLKTKEKIKVKQI